MTLTFSSEDVRNHLESLGYKNISDRQLKDFVKDLKRLIRYEEKQKRLEKLKTIEEHPKSSLVNQFLFALFTTFISIIKSKFNFYFFLPILSCEIIFQLQFLAKKIKGKQS